MCFVRMPSNKYRQKFSVFRWQF